jgi:hypothetical protein
MVMMTQNSGNFSWVKVAFAINTIYCFFQHFLNKKNPYSYLHIMLKKNTFPIQIQSAFSAITITFESSLMQNASHLINAFLMESYPTIY